MSCCTTPRPDCMGMLVEGIGNKCQALHADVQPGAYVRFRFGGQGIELAGIVESLATDPHGEPCAWVEIAGFSGAWKLRERVELMRVERQAERARDCDSWCGRCEPSEMCRGVGLE